MFDFFGAGYSYWLEKSTKRLILNKVIREFCLKQLVVGGSLHCQLNDFDL